MEEKSIGKITFKFIYKLILWLILLDVIIGIGFLMFQASGFEKLTDDVNDLGKALNGMVTGLVIINVLATVLSTLLATKKIKKKYKITEENKKAIFRNITIVLIIFAVLVGLVHSTIKNFIFDIASEGSDMTMEEVKEAAEDIEKYIEETEDLTDEDFEIIQIFTDFMGLADVYVYDCLAFIVMIPVEYFLIVKKKEEENA